MKAIVGLVFGLGMILNALLFVPQAITIWRAKRAEGVSILTFFGFNAMQAVGVLHGYFEQDWPLVAGMSASFLTCGSVTLLATLFRSGQARA
jgi:MtN3 and saliva related transmembrane protein